MDEISISHSVAWSLIPWSVNDTINADDRERLQRHLDDCGECHAQYLLECRIRERMQADVEVDDGADSALVQLFARIDADQGTAGATTASPSVEAVPRWNRWLAAAGIVQAIGLGTLGAMYVKSTNHETPTMNPEYRTLSRPASIAQTAVIRFVPAPDMSIASMHSVLAAAGLKIVDSSPHSAIFGLALAPREASAPTAERIAIAVRTLSDRPDVLFAEPILLPAPSTDD